MKLYTRPGSPYWWMDFTIEGMPRVQRSTKRPKADRKGAERYMASEYERLLNRVQFGDKDEITISDAFDQTLKTIENEATWKQYNVMRRKWIGEDEWSQRWHLDPKMLLSELRQIHLDEHKHERRAEGLKPNSINAEIRVFRRVVNYARKRFVPPQDELEFSQLPRFVKTRWLSDAEMEAIYAKLREGSERGAEGYKKAYSLCLFLRWTGMRISEALEVDWSELNLTTGTAEFFREKTDTVSEVPLPQALIEDLKLRHNAPHPFGNMDWPIKVLRKVINEVANRNPKIVRTRGAATIHTLRDTYATHLLNEGISLHKLASLLGHTTEGMAAKYGHIKPATLREEVRGIIDRKAS